MKPGTKFALGASLIVCVVTLMIVEGIKDTGKYFLTPTQLMTRTQEDPQFYNVGVKVSAKVVPGSIKRDAEHGEVDFTISDGAKTFPVTYSGLLPDTFTDANDIDVVVEGKLGREGTFHAVELVAKCGSRYEAAYGQSKKT